MVVFFLFQCSTIMELSMMNLVRKICMSLLVLSLAAVLKGNYIVSSTKISLWGTLKFTFHFPWLNYLFKDSG